LRHVLGWSWGDIALAGREPFSIRDLAARYGGPAVRHSGQIGLSLPRGPEGRTIGHAPRPPLPQPADTQIMFAVNYEDGRSAYIRVSPEAARYGQMVVMSIAREQQKAGEIPDGILAGVKQVR